MNVAEYANDANDAKCLNYVDGHNRAIKYSASDEPGDRSNEDNELEAVHWRLPVADR